MSGKPVAGDSLRTIRIICSDPDATDDSSSDEKNPSSKRIVREIHLNLKKMASKKSTPYPGAHRRKSGWWSSEIKDRPNGRRIWLGTFRTPEEASEVYLAKKKELDAAKKNELDASKRGMVSSSHKKRNKPIEFFVEEIKNPGYNEEIVGAYENWVKTRLEGGMVMVASHRKRNKPINDFGEEIETQLKKNPVYCKEIVGDYENRVKTQMGIRAKESKRESLNESPSSVLPDVFDELATCEIDPQIRKPVYSEELAAASKNLLKTQLGIGGANESGSESVTKSFSSVLGKRAEADLYVLCIFLHYRITNPVKNAYPLWLLSVICEIWFAVSWILDQFPKWLPLNRETYLDRLSRHGQNLGTFQLKVIVVMGIQCQNN